MRRFIDTARRALDFGSNVGDLRVIPSMPVIVIQGDADRLVRVENTRKWIDEMKSLGMTFEQIEVPGGDHMVPFIRTPENMRKVFDFLDAHPKKQSAHVRDQFRRVCELCPNFSE